MTTFNLRSWAAKWNVPLAALQEMEAAFGTDHPPRIDPSDHAPGSEARQQSLITLEAARLGIPLLRNNVGALMDKNGRPVRYGLANETKERNKLLKSADLIGIRPRLIVADDVGTTIGQFLSLECKAEDWRFTGNAHELAQQRWAQFVTRFGGEARFITSPEQL